MLAARERGARPGDHRVAAPGWLDAEAAVTGALGSTDTTAQLHPARFTEALMGAADGPRRGAAASASWRAWSAARGRPAG